MGMDTTCVVLLGATNVGGTRWKRIPHTGITSVPGIYQSLGGQGFLLQINQKGTCNLHSCPRMATDSQERKKGLQATQMENKERIILINVCCL